MKTILKLLITLAVLNALARSGQAAWTYFQFKNATQQLITFGSQTSTTALREEIVRTAVALDLPLAPADVTIHRDGRRTTVTGAYTDPVELFPGYRYPVEFPFTVEVTALNAVRPEDPPVR